MDEDLDELIARKATLRELVKLARSKGAHSLAQDAIRRIIDGTTSFEEAVRVVDMTSLQ